MNRKNNNVPLSSVSGEERRLFKGILSRKKVIIAAIAAVLLAGGIAFAAVGSNGFDFTGIRTSLQMGDRCLFEEKYEQAVMEFEKALDIEPMNVDARLGIAEAYFALGKADKAIETLEKDMEQIGSQRLKDKLEEIRESLKPVTIMGAEYDIAATHELDLMGKGITDEILRDIMPEIKKLVNLKELDLRLNQITDITPLGELSGLTGLYLYGNKITDITPLENLTKLTVLRLDSNRISDLAPLAKLTGLTKLYLNNNWIIDISALEGLTNLTHLSLFSNEIMDITPLAQLTDLTELMLDDNQISDIAIIEKLYNLTNLTLSLNQITDITPLAGLTDLTILSLSSNRITDIVALEKLTNLKMLELAENQITDITIAAGLTKLNYLRVSGSDQNIEYLRSKLPGCRINSFYY